jgi:hypothetical protein
VLLSSHCHWDFVLSLSLYKKNTHSVHDDMTWWYSYQEIYSPSSHWSRLCIHGKACWASVLVDSVSRLLKMETVYHEDKGPSLGLSGPLLCRWMRLISKRFRHESGFAPVFRREKTLARMGLGNGLRRIWTSFRRRGISEIRSTVLRVQRHMEPRKQMKWEMM